MTTAIQRVDLDDQTILRLVSDGDCSKLNPEQRLQYYRARCDAAGLDYRAQPFQYITLSGKLVLYALKGATDQLSATHRIAVEILDQRTEADTRIVTVRARTGDGRSTDEIGAVGIKGLAGDALANALMKAVTKAKRRAILAICGLGMLDETELETCAVGPTPPTAPGGPGAANQVRHLADLAASSASQPRPVPAAAPVSEGRAAATSSSYSEDEFQTVTVTRAFHDLKEGTSRSGKPYSFTKHSAQTSEGFRLSTIKDDIGTMLEAGKRFEVVLGEQKYGSYEILDIREVIDAALADDSWPAMDDLSI